MKRIALIDGNSLINRAYYAMKVPMITKEGIVTHAIYGFINMMDKIQKDYEPEYMAIAFDMKAPTFRHEEYSEYKAGRKKMPDELAMEIPILKDILDAMHIRRIEIAGFEADDIIGTLARKSESEGLAPLIFTGDKDQLQLATDVTKIVYTKRGVSDFDLYDHDAFVEKYGFTPLQFIDYKGLAGDSSDNIPGVPGVGDKTATKLIKEYGSVENIIENVDNIKPAGLQTKIENNKTQALMSKQLATIITDVPLDVTVEDCLIGDTDYNKLVEIYTKLEFNRFLSKLRKEGNITSADSKGSSAGIDTGSGADEDTKSDINIDKANIEIIEVNSDDQLQDISLKGETVLKVFGDNNHLGEPAIFGVAIFNDNKYYFVITDKATGFCEWFIELISNSDKDRDSDTDNNLAFIGHDLKCDYYMLMSKGKDLPQRTECKYETKFDTAIAQYVLDPSRSNYDLSALSNEYLQESIEDEKSILEKTSQLDMFTDNTAIYREYGLDYVMTVLKLKALQEAQIKREKLETVLYDVELPLVEIMASMEVEGIKTDKVFIAEYGDHLTGEIDSLAQSIYELAGEEFNINSPKQLGDILFEKLELPHGKKTKRGYSTSADVLEKIKSDHPIIPQIMEYRTLAKLKGTYVDGLIPLINDDGKIHAHFQQTVTQTGRISCTEPNLQNIPIRQELGRRLRNAFVPETGDCCLIGADYSQIELRVLAHMAGDEVLISAFNNGEDIHRATASNVLGIPEDEITPAERSRAKAVNFGVIYGMSAFGLSGELNISRKEANEYIDTYFEKHERVKAFMDNSVETAKAQGYVTTLLGRKRYINELSASNFMVRQVGERLAMNTPIQGSAADIIKLAMIKVYDALRDQGLKSRMILQIHDELIINTYPDEIEEVTKLLVENMESAYKLAVDLKVDCNQGANWYELK